jgi:hypothetical protein
MKQFSLIVGLLCLSLGLLFGQLDLVGMVQKVSANHGRAHSFVLPPFRAFYTVGLTQYYPYQQTLDRAQLHMMPFDVNGDGLQDLVYQSDGDGGLSLVVSNSALNGPRTYRWQQEVWINNGNGFDKVTFCTYLTLQEYEANCL